MKIITDRREVTNLLFDVVAPQLNGILFNGIHFNNELLELLKKIGNNNSNLVFNGCTFENVYDNPLSLYITCKGILRFQNCSFTNIELNANNRFGSCIFNNIECRTTVFVTCGRSHTVITNSDVHAFTFFVQDADSRVNILNTTLYEIAVITNGRISNEVKDTSSKFLSINKSSIEVLDVSRIPTGFFGIRKGDPLLKALFESGIKRVYLPKYFYDSDLSGLDMGNVVFKLFPVIEKCNVRDLDLTGTYNSFNKGRVVLEFSDCIGFDSTILPDGVEIHEEADQYFKVKY